MVPDTSLEQGCVGIESYAVIIVIDEVSDPSAQPPCDLGIAGFEYLSCKVFD